MKYTSYDDRRLNRADSARLDKFVEILKKTKNVVKVERQVHNDIQLTADILAIEALDAYGNLIHAGRPFYELSQEILDKLIENEIPKIEAGIVVDKEV